VRLLACLPILLAALTMGGCGGDDDEGGGGAAARLGSGEPLEVVAREYSFQPAAVVLSGGGELTIRLDNRGSLAHNLRLLRGGEDVGGTPTFPDGETGTGEVTVEPGRYELVCSVGDHAELGMTGELQVKE
jgi:plastocyanin